MKYIQHPICSIFILLLICFISSCSEIYEYEFESQAPLLVVEGLITNTTGPHYVRLTESINEVVKPDYSGSPVEITQPITGAMVTLSDDMGNTEELRYTGHQEGTYPETQGWYIIEEIEGAVGRTYTLTIEWNGKIYTAEDRMEPVPAIEKVGFKRKHLSAKNEDVDIPLIYFYEPQGVKNYYLMYYSVDGFFGSNRNWSFSILNDEFLDAHVDGLEMDDGQSPTGQDFYEYIGGGAQVDVYLESLSEPAYEFYRGVIDQFDADGGAFSPAPATPVGNISGGALGLFRASAVSKKSTTK